MPALQTYSEYHEKIPITPQINPSLTSGEFYKVETGGKVKERKRGGVISVGGLGEGDVNATTEDYARKEEESGEGSCYKSREREGHRCLRSTSRTGLASLS